MSCFFLPLVGFEPRSFLPDFHFCGHPERKRGFGVDDIAKRSFPVVPRFRLPRRRGFEPVTQRRGERVALLFPLRRFAKREGAVLQVHEQRGGVVLFALLTQRVRPFPELRGVHCR